MSILTPRIEPALRFLILGLARSGTTLLQRLACELPGVWVPRETHFWPHALRGAGSPVLTPAVADTLMRKLVDVEAPSQLPVDVVERVLTSMTDDIRRWELFSHLVRELSPPDSTVLGEKTPSHLPLVGAFLGSHPDLRAIVLVRDPRAIFASHLSVPWGVRDAHAFAWRWRLRYGIALDAVDSFGSAQTLLLRYEDVVHDPAHTQRMLANFLDVPFEPHPIGDRAALLFHESEGWKDRSLTDPEPSRIGGWRYRLAKEDVATINYVTGPLARRLGYHDLQADEPRVPLSPRPYLQELRQTSFYTGTDPDLVA